MPVVRLWISKLFYQDTSVTEQLLTLNQSLMILQSGPKVLYHLGVSVSNFPRSLYPTLIHTVLTQAPLLSATLRQVVVRVGIPLLTQGFAITIPSHIFFKYCSVKRMNWAKLCDDCSYQKVKKFNSKCMKVLIHE